MINIKPLIYKELEKLTDNVTDTYPDDWEHFPVVIYLEEENKPYEQYDNQEQKHMSDIRSISLTTIQQVIWLRLSTLSLQVWDLNVRLAKMCQTLAIYVTS